MIVMRLAASLARRCDTPRSAGRAPWGVATTSSRKWWPGLLVALLAAACGSGGDDFRTGERTAAASPFTFDPAAVPRGYELVVAGRGNKVQDWGSDTAGTDEPFTVLAPPGEDASSDRAVVVSVTGFEGYEGGLDQASLSDGGGDLVGDPWADVVVQRGEDLAVRVTSPGVPEEELAGLARRVEPAADRKRAPAVDVAGDLEVLGSVDADALLAFEGGFLPYSDEVPGPEGSYSAGWVTGGRGSLVVQTLRGDAADLAALGGLEAFAHDQTFAIHSVELGGAAAAVVEWRYANSLQSWSERAVVVPAASGELVVVVASGPTVPERDELLALAETVRPTDPRSWDSFVTEATGGPGLNPDPGATEVMRGTEGSVDWLLQAWPDAQSAPVRLGEFVQAVEDRPGPVVDNCLKLSTGERACTPNSGSEQGIVYGYTHPRPEGDIPPFAIFQTEAFGAAVRVTTTSGTVTADLHELAGGGSRAAVVFAEISALAGCDGLPRVEVLAADGGVIACLGG
jgi:hypothetical protein